MTPDHARDVTDWLYAIANPIRLHLVEWLAGGEMTSSALAAAIGRSTALASHHLGLLAEGGVATSRADGWYRHYSLINSHVADGVLTLSAHGITFKMRLDWEGEVGKAEPGE